jgi:Arc/MetJ-type ribon-helix-helix transcriptional regulator
MITEQDVERIRGWFTGRLPEEWRGAAPEIAVDREEITVMLHLPDVELGDDASEAEVGEARAGRTRGFREDTRERRIEVAREAEHRFRRKVSWGVVIGDRRELFTHVAAPVMTRLRQPQRQVLDTLIEAGVARSRSEALDWCVRLVQQHADSWLAELREAMTHVADVRNKGPAV